ncbi:MAG TPA: glycerol-3-phosphate acyltransferase, partial [Nitrospinae bacterium]|nr:glycerol-3-phosphate acyltransferase [Nitrospinota bacterium]
MLTFFTVVLIGSLAYALGSVSPGWFAGRARGLDLRFEGQETLGFVNAANVLGTPVGVMVFAADLFKGYLAVGAALLFTDSPWMGVLAGLAAVAGQIWPLFHDFSGGRGGATAAGVLVAASPWT